MKTITLLLCLFLSLITNGQTDCEDANSYLVSAYSHVKNAYDSNNLSHLKYYSSRSLESLELSIETLSSCGCETALDLTKKSIDLLAEVESVETFEDGRFYVNRARNASKESVIEIDKCEAGMYKNKDDVSANDALADLQNEQLKLKQQQEALKQKEEQIKLKLAKQKEDELKLKKQQLILSYKEAISSNIINYNETLKICDCNSHKAIEDINESDDLSSQSIENIKTYYNSNLKKLASNYISQLEVCDK
ncbi:hypothetical protein [Algibacter aquimarinus]|uniref:Uncharacterized protein n=1 Tax=Algibacter aquimarinus TaxID=1136748 RepID=A0ABP9HS93_9FLAO